MGLVVAGCSIDDDQPIPPPPAVAGDQLVPPPPPSTAGDGVSTVAAAGVGWRGTDGARCDPEGCGMGGV